MRLTFKLYAMLTDYLPSHVDGQIRKGNIIELQIAEGTSVQAMIDRFNLPPRLVQIVLVNGVFIPPERRATHLLVEGDALAIWPPVAGG
jgi:thiamine biosynthesis protein ThiS